MYKDENLHTVLFNSEHANSFTMGFITGAIVTTLKDRINKKSITKESIKNTLKIGTQSGIVSCAINDAKNRMECGDYTKAALSLALGTAGVYVTEKFANSLEEDECCDDCTKIEVISDEA